MLRLLLLALLVTPLPASADPSWSREAQLITVAPRAGGLEGYGRTLIAIGRVRPGRIESVVYDLAATGAGPPSLPELVLGRARVRALRAGTVSRALARYAGLNRVEVTAQRLLLDERQLGALHAALQAELELPARPLLPIRAGDAARVRDLLDRTLGGELRRRLEGTLAGPSLRALHRRALAEDLPGLLALDLFLGRRLDRPYDGFEAAGLPEALRDVLGRGRPALADPPRPVLARGAPSQRAPGYSPAAGAALLLAALLLVIGGLAWWRASHRLAALFLLAGPVPLGLLGSAQLALALASELPEARANELPFFFLPADLLLIAPAIAWLRGRPGRRGRLLVGYAWARLAFALAGIGGHALGVLVQKPRELLAPAIVSALWITLLARRLEMGRLNEACALQGGRDAG